MIGQISASNQLRTSSELAPNMFGASSELASVMEFGFIQSLISSTLLMLRGMINFYSYQQCKENEF